MKTNLIMTLILFLMMIFLPLITLADSNNSEKSSTVEQATSAEETSAAVTTEKPTEQETVTLTVSATGKVTEMSVEEYVYGAVCAEMPASFHKEALKAQAVASYTYMKWLKENADNPSENQSDISDNPSVHQAFMTDDELKEKWGSSYSIYSQKVREAVECVLYEYLTYNEETAMTVFHGLSPGKTVSSADVWGSEVPYLKSVTAPGDKLSPDIITEVELSKEEFVKPFSTAKEEDSDSLFKDIKKNDNNFVSEISYGNQTLSATDLRSAYSLKSPYFTAEKTSEGVKLTVYGKGHGVGMSQYSADYMARQGSTYKEILAHFYKGTELITK